LADTSSAGWSEIHPDRLTSNRIEAQSDEIESNGGVMKMAKKRAKSKTSSKRRVNSKKSSKRVAAKSQTRKQTKTKRPTKSKKSSLPNTSKLKRVAKEAAVAAGVAALGTALSAMEPQRKGAEKEDTSKN
jgi:hypothetical protein